MGQIIQRATPGLPAALRKTYSILAPTTSHTRLAGCAEVECAAHAHGWITRLDESDLDHAGAAHAIRHELGRRFLEERGPDGITTFTFEPGQRCFRPHRVPLERPGLFVVSGGDFRGNPRGTPPLTHSSPEAWRDDLGEHLEVLSDRIKQG